MRANDDVEGLAAIVGARDDGADRRAVSADHGLADWDRLAHGEVKIVGVALLRHELVSLRSSVLTKRCDGTLIGPSGPAAS